MKRLLPLLIMVLLVSCSSTKKTQAPSTINSSSSSTAVKGTTEIDGSSYDKAIVVKEKNETKGIAAEYKWLRDNYPGYKLISQSLDTKEKKRYDIMEIETANGEKKTVYFDITNFFGKW